MQLGSSGGGGGMRKGGKGLHGIGLMKEGAGQGVE